MSIHRQYATPSSAIMTSVPVAPSRARHAKPRQRLTPVMRTVIRSAGLLILGGVAIVAAVGGPSGSASAEDPAATPTVVQERPRALPLVGPSAAGIVELLANVGAGPGWRAPES